MSEIRSATMVKYPNGKEVELTEIKTSKTLDIRTLQGKRVKYITHKIYEMPCGTWVKVVKKSSVK